MILRNITSQGTLMFVCWLVDLFIKNGPIAHWFGALAHHIVNVIVKTQEGVVQNYVI